MAQYSCMLLLHAEHGIVLIYITSTHTHNMTQYCCTLLLHAEHGIVLIYITCTDIIWHSTPLRYLYIHNMAQCCSALLLHANHGIVMVYITCTHIIWHSTALHYFYMHGMAQYRSCYFYMHGMAQYRSVLLLHAQYGTVPLCVTFTCTVWDSTTLCYPQMHQQPSVLFAHATYYC